MDRPRHRWGTAGQREAARMVGGLALISTVVLAVGLLPVLFVWIGMKREAVAASTGPAPRERAPARAPLRDRTPLAPAPFDLDQYETLILESRGAELAATVLLPQDSQHTPPYPAMVVVHGSGPSRRSHYRWIAEQLTAGGYATLIYDKRGVGESTGHYTGIGPYNSHEMFDLLADDALAGVEYLRTRGEVDPSRIGLFGISQGGWISPLAATRSRAVSFLVVVSGPAVTVGEEIFYSKLTGEQEGTELPFTDRELSGFLEEFEGPHGFDPRPFLARVNVPTLWLLGKGDRSLPVPETAAQLEHFAERGRPIELQLFPGVGHGMRSLDSGERLPYLLWVFDFLEEL